MNQKVNILMLGIKGVGKKTLLKNATHDVEPHQHDGFNFWSYQKTTFILPKYPLEQQHIDSLPHLHTLIIMIDIASIIDTSKTEHILIPQLNLIKVRYKKISIQLIVTKCDYILGFKEFFNHLNSEERQRIFGFQPQQGSTDLLRQINAQVIPRLHQETLPEKRSLIQLFPSQFEKAIEYLSIFVDLIHAKTGLCLMNVYFTSCKQKHKSIDLLGNHKTTLPPTITEKSFFIEHMINQICEQATLTALAAKRFDKKRWIILPICIIILITLITTWHYSYKHTAIALHEISLSLEQKPPTNIQPTWLARLDLLATSIQKLNDPSLNYSWLVGFGQTKTLKQKITHLYKTELRTEFLPYIEGILNNNMIQGMQHDKLTLYNSLKIYLMLTTPNHYDENTITNWFEIYWQHTYKKNPQQQKMLLEHLKNLLTLENKNWPRNQPIITKAQQILQQLPLADIIFLELQGKYKDQQQSLATMIPNHTSLNLKKAVIPNLFSPNNFKEIYNQQIPLLVNTFSQGDWVIGNATYDTHASSDQQSQLTADVRALYLQYFSQSWQNVLTEIELQQPSNFTDIQSLINELTNPQSSLMELLEFASGNAELDKKLQPSDALTQVNDLIQHKALYQKIKITLQSLSTYLKTIVRGDDINKASFDATIAILNNQQPQNPIARIRDLKLQGPIQNWLRTISQGSWSILLANSRDYLNNVWSSTVLPVYESKINDRYPFSPASKEDISLTNFDDFIGPEGTIDTFFNYYLKPFVNMSSNYWTWRTVYDQKIAIPQSILDTFMRASLIQQMFYTDDTHKMSFKFSLSPFTKSSNIKLLTLDIEGQIQQFDNTNQKDSIMTWPGPVPTHVSINASFYKETGITQSFTGPWALFRLLQTAQISLLGDPQKFVVQFKIGNGLAAYHLIADNRINPFIPGVLDKFNCPQNL